MSQSYNPYADCPCGSGKKVKFCCTEIAEEIVRINRLWENEQFEQVHMALEHLLQKPIKNAWSRAWVKTTLAMSLPPDDPRQIPLVDEVLAEVPDHPRANTLKAGFEFNRHGYPAAREHIEQAFEHLHQGNRGSAARLAEALSQYFFARRQWLAAARYLNLTIVLEPTEERMYGLVRFLQSEAPFPTRGAVPLRGTTKSANKDLNTALLTATKGASFKGARLYEELAKKDPDNTDLWFNAGVCYAGCGESADAIRCLRTSVKKDPDFERAVDTECLAQIVEQPLLEKAKVSNTSWTLTTGVSELLSKFDAQPRWIREEQDEDEGAMYLILDRDVPSAVTLDSIPRVLAYVEVYEALPDGSEPAELVLRAGPLADHAALLQQVRELAGGTVQGEPKTETGGVEAAEIEALYQRLYFPPDVKPAEARALRKAMAHHLVDQAWPNQNLTALGNKTPLEAAHDPALKIPLAAAVIVLESIALAQDLPVDRDAVRERFGLPPTETFDKPEGVSARDYSLLELTRLSFASVSDEELPGLIEFIQIANHPPLRERALNEVLSRPEMMKTLQAPAVYLAMARCCAFRFAKEEALAWLNRARQELQTAGHDPTAVFQMRLKLDVEELRIREDDPKDPALTQLANRLWLHVQKVPELRADVAETLKKIGIPGPWSLFTESISGGPDLVTTGSSLWTPGSEQPAATTSGGLWVPE